MSTALAEYLSALEARDVGEKAHGEYVDAYTRLADRRATPATHTSLATAETADASSASTVAQLRAELAVTQRTRGELETQLTALTTALSGIKTTDAQQKQRIEQLEKVRSALERRGKDRADELKGKGRFVEEVQDEMVALNLQLNMAEQDKEKLKRENEELTRRWVQKMEDEARQMNDRMGWDESGRRKGNRS